MAWWLKVAAVGAGREMTLPHRVPIQALSWEGSCLRLHNPVSFFLSSFGPGWVNPLWAGRRMSLVRLDKGKAGIEGPPRYLEAWGRDGI